MRKRQPFQNFQVDHMTLLLQPQLYNVAYVIFQVIFGAGPEDVLYEKRKKWDGASEEESMTFAVRLGEGANPDPNLNNTVVAVVQPSEPKGKPSHVREMLDGHQSAAHWQHIALRTTDLLTFHKHALERGIQFITPILKDDEDDLIQVFSGEWYFPDSKPSGMFFEFLQRNPSKESMEELENQNRELWFRDKTFLGLYGEKETEYQTGKVTPFIDFEIYNMLYREFGQKKLWDIGEAELKKAEDMMLEFGKRKK